MCFASTPKIPDTAPTPQAPPEPIETTATLDDPKKRSEASRKRSGRSVFRIRRDTSGASVQTTGSGTRLAT